jgi:hypothetical protein
VVISSTVVGPICHWQNVSDFSARKAGAMFSTRQACKPKSISIILISFCFSAVAKNRTWPVLIYYMYAYRCSDAALKNFMSSISWHPSLLMLCAAIAVLAELHP